MRQFLCVSPVYRTWDDSNQLLFEEGKIYCCDIHITTELGTHVPVDYLNLGNYKGHFMEVSDD